MCYRNTTIIIHNEMINLDVYYFSMKFTFRSFNTTHLMLGFFLNYCVSFYPNTNILKKSFILTDAEVQVQV